jgi:hypothetical protein
MLVASSVVQQEGERGNVVSMGGPAELRTVDNNHWHGQERRIEGVVLTV